MDVPVTMHCKFQQSSPIYSGTYLRFRSSTECWLLQLLHRDRAHSAKTVQILGDSTAQFLEWSSTCPLVCKRQGFGQTVEKTVVPLTRWSMSLLLQFIDKVWTSQFATETGCFPQLGAMNGYFGSFCAIFRAPPVVPELSASFSSLRALTPVSARGLQGCRSRRESDSQLTRHRVCAN